MHRNLIFAVLLSALAAGPALAQEGGLDQVEMSITISPVTDVRDVGGSTDLSVDVRDRSDEAGEYHVVLPLHDDRDGDRDAGERAGSDAEIDHEPHDVEHDVDLEPDHAGDVGGEVGGDIDVPDTPDTGGDTATGDAEHRD